MRNFIKNNKKGEKKSNNNKFTFNNRQRIVKNNYNKWKSNNNINSISMIYYYKIKLKRHT